MLTVKYINDWRLIGELTFDYPYSQEQVYLALEQEEFLGTDSRTYCHAPKSIILQEMLDYVLKEAKRLLEEMCSLDQFKNDQWHLKSTEQMTRNTVVLGSFVRDAPGFNTDIHIDSRMTVCAGMLFFNKDNDSDQATTFYSSPNPTDPIQMSSQYGKGWYAANTAMNWHTGGNTSSRNRYAIMFTNSLNLVA